MTNKPTAIFCLLLSCLSVVQAAGGAVVFGVVPDREHAGQGVAVGRVAEQTPAQLAGLRAGDVIVSVQGTPTLTAAELKAALAEFSPRDVVRVQYLREGRRLSTLVELQGRPTADELAAEPAAEPKRELSPEILLQFSQARSRLRLQLARLPHGMNTAQVHADLRELLTLAQGVPSGHSQWLQGQTVELSMVLPHADGDIELRSENGKLSLAVYEPSGEEPVAVYPINTAAERAALPPSVLRRLQEL